MDCLLVGVLLIHPISGDHFGGQHASSDQRRPKIPVAEAASFLGVSKSWLDKHRVNGGGPAYLKIGRRVVYDLNDLEQFAAERRCRNTSDVVYAAAGFVILALKAP